MTAPISNEPTTTRLHHYAGHYSRHPATPHAGAVFLSSQPHPDPQAVQNSPCSAPPAPRRYKTRPARAKHPRISAFSPAGRILSRSHPESTPAGRVFSRRWMPQPPQNACRLPRLKPMTPMRVDHCHEMKPLTPVLPQNSQFQAIFRPRRRRRFHPPLTEHPQRRRWFHQASNQGCWFTARRSDAHACCLRGGLDSVGAVR